MDFSEQRNMNKDFLKPNMMGPNSMMILEELLEKVPLKPGMRVLDLGCGKRIDFCFPLQKNMECRFSRWICGFLLLTITGDSGRQELNRRSYRSTQMQWTCRLQMNFSTL